MIALIRMMLACLFCAQLSLNCLAQSGIITTYVGHSLPENGAIATSQPIDWPASITLDGAGGFFIACHVQNKVYRVTANDTLHIVAGTGISGYSGDGSSATSAQLNGPSGLALDVLGNLYIADEHNSRIRKVTSSGIISTVAGTGISGYSGDGGPAVAAQLDGPDSVALDASGNLYIADRNNNRIRKVSPNGIIRTVAGTRARGFSGDSSPATSAQLDEPNSVTLDASGNLYIADRNNNRIRKVTPDGIISTVAGNGTRGFSGDGGRATSAQLDEPTGVAVDAAGNLFIADYFNFSIRKVTPDGIISTVAGGRTRNFSGDGGIATSAQLNGPRGVAVDAAGNLFITDVYNFSIWKVTLDGIISTVAGDGTKGYSGDGGPATSAQLDEPTGVAVDASGNLFIADRMNHRIRKVTPGGIISTFAGTGVRGYSGDGGPATSAQLYYPDGLAVDALGNLCIGDTDNHRIRKVSLDGTISTVAGNGTAGYTGDGGSATSAQLNHPDGVAVDALGNLYIADGYNHRIRKVTPGGIISTVAGNGTGGFGGDGGPAKAASLAYPTAVAIDAFGNLFIADFGNQRIRKVTPDGIISTLAGTGIRGFSGDGGPAKAASLANPTGIAVNSLGDLFIADQNNNRIRKVTGQR